MARERKESSLHFLLLLTTLPQAIPAPFHLPPPSVRGASLDVCAGKPSERKRSVRGVWGRVSVHIFLSCSSSHLTRAVKCCVGEEGGGGRQESARVQGAWGKVKNWSWLLEAFIRIRGSSVPAPQRVLASPHGLTHRCKGPRVIIIFQRMLESGFRIE